MPDVNIIDIAKLSGVSVSTVSRVINNHKDVSEKTRKRVLQIVSKYGYVPNGNARSLKLESLRAIGVVIKGFTNPFFTRMLAVIQSELEMLGYIMLLHRVDPDMDEMDAAAILTREKKPLGLIFLGGNFIWQSDKLSRLQIPAVMATSTIQKGVRRDNFSSVTIDDYKAAYETAERVYEAGHRKIVAIGHNEADRSVAKLRVDGFSAALRGHGLDFHKEQIGYAGDYTMSGGYEAIKQLAARLDFTCAFCVSDLIAIGVMRGLHDCGLRVPEDVSVVGFDGIDMGRFTIPTLATVLQPDELMAHEAVGILMGILEGGETHEHRLYETAFHHGESFLPLNV